MQILALLYNKAHSFAIQLNSYSFVHSVLHSFTNGLLENSQKLHIRHGDKRREKETASLGNLAIGYALGAGHGYYRGCMDRGGEGCCYCWCLIVCIA